MIWLIAALILIGVALGVLIFMKDNVNEYEQRHIERSRKSRGHGRFPP